MHARLKPSWILGALGSLLVASTATGGCTTGDGTASSSSSSSGQPAEAPVLESVDAPSSLSASNGAYTLAMDLTFRDPQNEAVTKVRFRIPAGNLDQTSDIANAAAGVRQASVSVVIGANVPPMTYTYFVSVIDAAGNESSPVSKEISLD